MWPISVILAVLLVGSHGVPQIDPATQGASVSSDPSTLISPWSQWMSLKAPPIGLVTPKKKKLLPGPPPPPGTPEAPWTTWTRMKISSALSPPSAMQPPAPPPSPVSDPTNASTNSSDEPSIWIQWTQMKLPMIGSSAGGSSSASSTPETPWDAWMKVRTSMAAPAAVATGTASAPSKRMAPDRYIIASTMAPKPALWATQPQQSQSSSSSNSNGNLPTSSTPQIQVSPSSSRPSYLDMMSYLPTPNASARLPNAISQYPGQTIPSGSSRVSNQPSPVSFEFNSPLSSQISTVSQVAPQIQMPRPIAPSTLPQPLNPAVALRPIPHQIVDEILSKGTPEEISSVIQGISNAENTSPEESPSVSSTESTVEKLLPPTLIAKLSPELRPLLPTPLEITPSTTVLAQKPPGAVSVPLSILPESIREPILAKATPQELDVLLTTLSKIERIPEPLQAPIAQLDVQAVIPSSLTAKLPAELKPVLQSKLAPPVLQASLPKPVLEAILKAQPSTPEVSLLVKNVAEVQKIAPKVNVPPPPLGVLIPPTLVSKLPPKVTPLLSKPLITPPSPPTKTTTLKVTNALSAIPPPVLQEIIAKASPTELSKIVGSLSLLEAKVPSESPLIGSILPPTLITKLSPEVKPLLGQTLVLPPVSVVSTIPEPILKVILQVATLEEVTEIEKKIEAVQDEQLPVKKPIAALLPANILVKIPPQIAPVIAQPVIIPPKISVTSKKPVDLPTAVVSVLSAAPAPVLASIVAAATPAEISEISQIIEKLEDLPPTEKQLVSKVSLESIIPPSLISKLSPAVTKLLETPVTLPTTTPPAPSKITEEPALISVLKAAPPPVLPAVLTAATPVELAEMSEVLDKLESLPPSEKALVSKVSLKTIIPESIVPKLPPTVVQLLDVPVVLPPSKEEAPAESSTESSKLPEIGVKPLPPPSVILPPIISTLSSAPPPVLPAIMAAATPSELVELSEIITKLESVPPSEKPLVSQISLKAIMPESLLPKLPPPILPLLDTPVTLPTPPISPLVKPPSETFEPATSPITPALISVLEAAPPTVLPAVKAIATPVELGELSDTIAKLEALSPTKKAQLSTVTLEDILPKSLVSKLPAPVIEALKTPVTLPEPTISPLVEPKIPPSIAPLITPALLSVLKSAPTPILPAVVEIATPAEIVELSDVITKLESLPLAEKPLVSKVILEAIMPESLISKLPPPVIPLLATPVILPASPEAPESTTEALVTTPASTTAILSVLKSAPPAILPVVATVATPAELAELSETIEKLEALPPTEKSLVSQIILSAILPPTLLEKIPPSILPLLNTPVILPEDKPETSVEIPTKVTVTPTLQAVPQPVLNSILSVATPAELEKLTETISELESLPPSEKIQIPTLPVLSVIPTTLASKLPPEVFPLLSEPLNLSPATTEPMTVTSTTEVAPKPTAEDKLLVKWAKKILLKTGTPSATVPGEIPPLQAAWMDWVQLKMNETTTKLPPTLPPAPLESTTQYPWTKWLKLKSNVSTEEVLASPTTPEEQVSEWISSLEATTTAPSAVTIPSSLPTPDDKIAEALKKLGVEKLDLPPDQVEKLLATLEKAEKPSIPSPIPTYPSGFPLPLPTPPLATYFPYAQPPPFVRPYFSPWVLPPPAPYAPTNPTPPTPIPSTATATVSTPSINVTEYLIQHKLIPPETPPTANIPISTLAKLLEEEVSESSSSESPSEITATNATERTLLAGELASLTPTKFAALLKQILKDCNRTVSHLSTRSSHSSKKKSKGGPISPIGQYYKNKYAKLKGPWAAKYSRALSPIPNEGVAKPPSSTKAPLLDNALPLPKVDTSGTVLDPAYWAAQKSMFLSKLFSTLAKVALNDTQSQNGVATSTPSPKEQLAKQVNKVLLGDITRSVKDSDSEEDSEEDSSSREDSDEVNEKKMVLEDNGEPSNIPKEPSNPLHKLFKFGVQKSVLSDLATTSRPASQTTSSTTSAQEKEMIDRLKKALQKTKPTSPPKKTKKKKSSKKHHHHHHHSKKKHSFRPTPPTTTTTENPIDFELLAKALLLDDNVGDPPKSQQGGGNGAT